MRAHERGESIVDALVATAIIAMVAGAVVEGALAATHQFGAQPVNEALRAIATRELRIAVDVLKYQGGSIAPATIATSAPMPGGSPIPIHLSITSAIVGGGFAVTVQAAADGRMQSATMSANVPQPVPLPSSEIASPSGGAAPI